MIINLRSLPLHQQLYALQVLEYQPKRYLRWWLTNWSRLHLERKKSLVWTGKARFLFFCSLLLQCVLTVPSAVLVTKFTNVTPFLLFTSYFLLFTFFTLFPAPLLLLSLLILKPYERINRQRTIRQVKTILKSYPRLKIIGITGSYGKTSVKDILAQTLSLKYKVLAAPQSYNTLFGIANFLKEKLKDEHEILIVEMGAYQKGEIRELCQMVKPHIGIITGITNQHLERFGSLENITAAKYELIEALPPAGGLAVFNLDSPPLLPLYQKTAVPKIGYAQEGFADISAVNIQASATSSTFTLAFGPSSNSPLLSASSFQLNLPGRHQISNALAAIAVALYLGLTPEQIRQGLSQVRPPSHRLQILPQPNGTLIIDDAYSSNPEGVKAAINLISQFSNSPKVIVTPGLVELGEKQEEENIAFGKLIAADFDYAVIVNKTNRRALLEGIKKGYLSERSNLKEKTPPTAGPAREGSTLKKYFVTDTLEEATKHILPRLVQPGRLVLFENDLPDIYL